MMTATATATVPKGRRETKRKRRDLLARARALGWSQNELARQIGKDIGHTSRVLRGLMASSPVWIAAEQVIAEAEAQAAAEASLGHTGFGRL